MTDIVFHEIAWLLLDAIRHLEAELEDAFGAGFEPASFKKLVGDPVAAVGAEAKSTHADLVIAGLSERPGLGSIDGTILEGLLMSASKPLIVVKSRPAGHYEKVLVGLDLSPTSRHALQTALQVAPTADVVIAHARESGAADDLRGRLNAVVRDCFAAAHRTVGMHEGSVEIFIEEGAVPNVLARHRERTKPDLVTFGKHNRGPSTEPYLGSGARGILENLEADMLVTPPWE